MQRVTRIDHEKTARLMAEALPLMDQSAQAFAKSVRVYVTNCRRGQANSKEKLVRIPAWVFNEKVNFSGKGLIDGGPAFAAYYLAHELAHVKAVADTHGPHFMAAFKELCPPDLQWYETIYKPKRAAAAGIVRVVS